MTSRRTLKYMISKSGFESWRGNRLFFAHPLTSFSIFLHRDVEPAMPHPTRSSASQKSTRLGRYARRRPGWTPYVFGVFSILKKPPFFLREEKESNRCFLSTTTVRTAPLPPRLTFPPSPTRDDAPRTLTHQPSPPLHKRPPPSSSLNLKYDAQQRSSLRQDRHPRLTRVPRRRVESFRPGVRARRLWRPGGQGGRLCRGGF